MRLISHMIVIAAAGSLVCAGMIGAMWIGSYRAAQSQQWSVRLFGTRHTIVPERGRVVVFSPPATTERTAEANRYVHRLTNNSVQWQIAGTIEKEGVHAVVAPNIVLSASGPAPLSRQSGPNESGSPKLDDDILIRPLLGALDDSHRFVVAHVLLAKKYPQRNAVASIHVRDYGLLVNFGGLWAELHTTLPSIRTFRLPRGDVRVMATPFSLNCQGAPSVYVDEAQMPAIRAYWHKALAVKSRQVSFWQILLPLLVLPAFCVLRWPGWRAAKRRARGLCPNCGYDLRESPQRCPECGSLVERGAVNDSALAGG